MGIQIIPSIADSLAPVSAQIAEGISTLINPNRKFQEAVQAAIARDPSVAQSFADLGADNPGLLDRLGIGALKGKPSIGKQFEVANREDILSAKKTNLDLEKAKGKYSVDQINEAMNLMSKDKSIRLDNALLLATGQNAAERTIEKEAAKQAPLDTASKFRKGQLEAANQGNELTKIDMQSQLINVQARLLADGPQVSLENLGQFDNAELAGIFSGPLGDAVSAMLRKYSDDIRLNISNGNGTNEPNWKEKLDYMEALDTYSKLQAGSPGAVYNYMFDPVARAKAQELNKASVVPDNQEDIDLMAVANAFETKNKAFIADKVSNINNKINTITEGIRRTSPRKENLPLFQQKADLLQSQLDQRSALTNTPQYKVEAYIDDGGFFGGARARLKFTDPAGNEIPTQGDEVIPTEIQEPTAFKEQREQKIRDTTKKTRPAVDIPYLVNAYKNMSPANQVKQLQAWRTQFADDPRLQDLEKALGIKP